MQVSLDIRVVVEIQYSLYTGYLKHNPFALSISLICNEFDHLIIWKELIDYKHWTN